MLYIFFGPDDYSKKLHLTRLTSGLALPVVRFPEDTQPEAGSLAAGDLFGGNKVFVLRNGVATIVNLENIELLKKSGNHIIFLEDSLDKRLTLSKKLLQDSDIKSKEFAVPEGRELVAWVISRAKELEGSIDAVSASNLLSRLGVPMEEPRGFGSENKVSIWQIDSEIKKLVTHSGNSPITIEVIESLVPENFETQGFDIINALAEKNKTKVFSLCERFFKDGGTDEKAKFILLNSLLADQFRSILMVQGFGEARVPESEILAKTGWKSGRLFMVKKIAGKFDQKKVVETLTKLESFDIELKTTSTPPHVLMDLILAQVV